MKLLSSSFSSLSSSSSLSSPTTTTSFDSKSPTASCLAGILRRILCSGTLPTYPSDHVTEDTNSAASSRHPNADDPKHPGLVARLMGLDSMPETNFRTSLSRSRSMNSSDRMEDPKTGLHRRVKSTASFRDNVPVFLELENDEFFILSFEEEVSRGGKLETGFGESKQRRRARCKRLENRAAVTTKKEDQKGRRKVLSDLNGKENRRGNSSDHNKARDSTVSLVPKKIRCQKRNVVGSDSEAVKPQKPKKISDNVVNSNGLRAKKKKNNSKLVKPVKPDQLNSEDWSPVSVLSCGQFLIDPKVPISEDGSTSSNSSRRKLSLDTEKNSDRKSPRRDDNLIVGEERKAEAKQHRYANGSRKTRSDWHENSSVVLDEICRASETELLGASWARKWTFELEEFHAIGEDLEAQILGQLIEELVTQFD